MSKIRGELRQLSPARRLLGLLPVLVVALAMVAALCGVGVAGATEPEVGSAVAGATADAGSAAADATADAGSAAEAEATSETTADADGAAAAETAAEETSEPAADAETDNAANSNAAESPDSNASASDADSAEADAETPAGNADDAAAKAAAPAVETEDEDLVGDTAYPTNATATAVSIQDDVKANGQFILKATIDGTEYTGAEAAARLAAAGYTVTWSKGNTTYNNGLQVKSGDTNVPAVEQNGGWINVAYTSGSKAEYTVTVSKDGASTLTASKTVGYANALENPSFETNTTPTNMLGNDGNPSSNTPGWKTTEAENTIEVLSTDHPNSGFLDSHEFTADDGKWFAEINAKSASALYQDVLTTPGQTMNWQFAHRARTGAGNPRVGDSDTMALIIAPLEFSEGITTDSQLKALNNGLNSGAGHSFRISSTDAYNRYTVKSVTQDSQGSTYVVHDNTTNKDYSIYKVEDTSTITQGSYTETYTWWGRTRTRTVNYLSSSWNRRSGSITVPEGQYTSRFFFMAVSSAVKDGNGGDSIGNFVDNTWFSQDPLPPASGTVRITVEKVVKGLSQADANAFFTAHASDLISQTVYDGKTASGTGTAETVTLTGVTAVDGGYKATYTKTYEDVETGSSKTFVTSENAGNVSVTGYDLKSTTIVDTNNGKAANGSIQTTLTSGNSDTSSATVTITNEYAPATKTLTITKKVNGGNTEAFSFVVTSDKAMSAIKSTDTTKTDDTLGTDGKTANLSLKNDEKVTITVPNDAKVTIKETNATGYNTEYAVGQNQNAGSLKDGVYTLTMAKDTDVTVTNTIKPVTLTIQKEIVGAQADLTKGYTFKVTRTTDGATATTTELKDPQGESEEGQKAKVTQLQKDGKNVDLQWGDTVTVTETDNTGYSTTYKVTVGETTTKGTGKATQSIKLEADNTTVVFTNTKTNTVITGIKSAGVPGALTAVAVAAFVIAGGMALLQRNGLESATTGAHTARGWHRPTHHKGADRKGSHMRGGDDA